MAYEKLWRHRQHETLHGLHLNLHDRLRSPGQLGPPYLRRTKPSADTFYRAEITEADDYDIVARILE